MKRIQRLIGDYLFIDNLRLRVEGQVLLVSHTRGSSLSFSTLYFTGLISSTEAFRPSQFPVTP
jgi:hypothetical protein